MNFSDYFNSDVLLGTQTLVEVSFSGLLPGLVKFQDDVTQRLGQIFLCRGTFWKTGESWIQQCKLHVVFTGIKHFSGGIFLKPMLMYDQGVVKIQIMGKQRYFASTMSMDL